ncbi:DUF2637 domain-containing protein [Nocardia abscessus]|uniref:DUF2637 domain-containing protein n=1 Tax=Nocardia abscessus TaxID=120957 RepID=UPI003CC80742
MATAMTALIATGAFWLSFTALRSLAVTADVPPSEAWLWPLIVEGSMAQSTVALLTLAHSSTHRDDGASPATRSTTERPRTTPVAPPTPVQSQAIPRRQLRAHAIPSCRARRSVLDDQPDSLGFGGRRTQGCHDPSDLYSPRWPRCRGWNVNTSAHIGRPRIRAAAGQDHRVAVVG